MKYKIIIQKINPLQENEDPFLRTFPREVNVFEAFINEEEVIELMRVGFFLKEKISHEKK